MASSSQELKPPRNPGRFTDGGLEAAIELANTDWRDLLMAAGFGEDLNAHQKWSQSIAN